VRSIDALPKNTARALETVVFDLDDTVLDHGVLREDAYRAMFRLREAGLTLVACTGRPASWAEIVARQWPVSAAIAENGAIAWRRRGAALELFDPVAPAERALRRERIERAAQEIERVYGLLRADDNAGRKTDLTFDIGEHHVVHPDTVRLAASHAARLGVRTFTSSVHLHLTLDTHDKATGFAALALDAGASPVRALRVALYVGDSTNDAAAFAAFGTTVGVANVGPWVRALTIPPRWVTREKMGAGFAELAQILATLRGAVPGP